jgi:hypothetical protein
LRDLPRRFQEIRCHLTVGAVALVPYMIPILPIERFAHQRRSGDDSAGVPLSLRVISPSW